MNRAILIITGLIYSSFSFAQIEPILITEQTIKVRKTKEFYFAFSEGDEIVFDLDITKGKNIKEVEIIEYPNTSKFHDFKSKGVKQKRIKVNKTAIYKFKIKGGGITTRVCRVKISRVPATLESQNFDTSVKWKTRLDSTYIQKFSKELVSIDTSFVEVINRTERVHSQTNLENSNISSFNVTLPKNKKTKLRTTELVSWAYWIGVGNEAQEAYEKEKKEFLSNSAATVVGAINPVAGLAIGSYAILVNPPSGNNVHYSIRTYYNGITHTLAKGNSIIASGRTTDIKQGGFTIRLENDNLMEGINVNVKIAAVLVTKQYTNRPYKELKVERTEYPVFGSTSD